MLKIIIVIIIIIVLIKIFSIYFEKSDSFINITNPFVDGLSQYQLGADKQDNISTLNISDLPDIPDHYSNNIVSQTNNTNFNKKKSNKVINKINKISNNMIPNIIPNIKQSKINQDIQIVKNLKNKKNNKNSLPCKKLNKFFMQTQFSDSYRDTLTALNYLCPDQKNIFNLQSLPVITTKYQLQNPDTPFVFIKLISQFLNKLNKEIKSLPESYEIINNFNNYMPLTSQLKKYTENKGINKFYKDIGVDYNLYADTPPNSPVELIKIISARREYTDAETKYVITFVIKKILKSINDQLQLTVHFVTKNDPLEGYNLFDSNPPTQTINSTQQIAIEFIFVDGFYTNDFNVDYDCVGTDNGCNKKVSNIDGDDNFYSFDALGTDNLLSDYEIIKEFNKKNREHEIEMNNFNINVPYPIYENSKNNI